MLEDKELERRITTRQGCVKQCTRPVEGKRVHSFRGDELAGAGWFSSSNLHFDTLIPVSTFILNEDRTSALEYELQSQTNLARRVCGCKGQRSA